MVRTVVRPGRGRQSSSGSSGSGSERHRFQSTRNNQTVDAEVNVDRSRSTGTRIPYAGTVTIRDGNSPKRAYQFQGVASPQGASGSSQKTNQRQGSSTARPAQGTQRVTPERGQTPRRRIAYDPTTDRDRSPQSGSTASGSPSPPPTRPTPRQRLKFPGMTSPAASPKRQVSFTKPLEIGPSPKGHGRADDSGISSILRSPASAHGQQQGTSSQARRRVSDAIATGRVGANRGSRSTSSRTRPRRRRSRSRMAGTIFPVARVSRNLRKRGLRVGATAGVYATAVLEYLTAELIDVSGVAVKRRRKKRITPLDIRNAIGGDVEFLSLERDVTIPRL